MGSPSTRIYAANFTLCNLKELGRTYKSHPLRVGDNARANPRKSVAYRNKYRSSLMRL